MTNENSQPSFELGRKLSELQNYHGDDPSELLKQRFLCREGVLGLYGQTGIGKSSFSMQCMILWGLCRPVFGIAPKQPIKSLLIQAENDDGDIAEMRDGVCDGLGLTAEEKLKACENIIVIHEDSKVGTDFFIRLVKPALEKHKPDMLWIDCALSYLGGDAISQEVVGVFLRVGLNPLLKEFKCGCVIIHHTNKSKNDDSAYAGSGSAEWANMPRAILVLSSAGKKGTFELTAAKRGQRLKWKMPDGETIALKKHLVHSSLEGRIFWEEIDVIESNESQQANKQQDQESEILQRVPKDGDIWQKLLIAKVNQETGIGQNKIKELIAELISSNRLFVVEHPRTTGKPRIHYRLTPDIKAEKMKQLLQQIREKQL